MKHRKIFRFVNKAESCGKTNGVSENNPTFRKEKQEMKDQNEKFSKKIERKWHRFTKRLKEDPTHRAICITAVLLILAVTLLITVTVIANRAKKQNLPGTDTTVSDTTSGVPSDTTAPPETSAPSTEPVDAIPSTFLLPVSGSLTKGHDATTQVFSNTMQDYRVHLGIDINTTESAPVYAAADGTVERIWEDVRYGQCVAVSHSGDCVTVYKNLSLELAEGITEGASVSAGALLGAVGNTAMVEIADEPHLHFEMTVGGLAVDPLEYFDASALASLSVDESYEG